MLRFDCHQFAQSAQLQGNAIVLSLPLPHSPAEANRLITQFAQAFECKLHAPDWGADRLQVLFTCHQQQYLFHIEWLCEAIWIEPVGANDEKLTLLWEHITAK
ncbi:DUF3630 family protein [Aestuariibacter sp. A3R04]|uniref:DUF3630 family protein n=1 Tax=Aestuariibacter sp. A3R04 TaxID=2841571 RepID=UPI001C083230|nr:DUF3630 family protein [Aestuariibacter sp. A3R04]MBU3023684.1 DUF3630 family protein [Aestuariibacter sp. A3R04]